MKRDSRIERLSPAIALSLGFFSIIVLLAYNNIADGDLWARLAQGASILKHGKLIRHDIFAFTPVLPEYIDHAWGAGLIFFSLLNFAGPESLLVFKIIIACLTMLTILAIGRGIGSSWTSLLLIMIPSALVILPAYFPVVRSYVFTYLFFAIFLLLLEEVWRGKRWPLIAIPLIMIVWVNVHGGFVAGLGAIGIYIVAMAVLKKDVRLPLAALIASIAATFINPFGAKLWGYLASVLTHPRIQVNEWRPIPLIGIDLHIGFRILFIVIVCILAANWGYILKTRSAYRFFLLVITAYLGFRYRRHVPLFGITAAAFAGPYLDDLFRRLSASFRGITDPRKMMAGAILTIYGVAALLVILFILPQVSFIVLAPVGFYPVREADILMHAQAKGNLVVPLRWGNYAMWRLYPNIKVSMCGRSETIYPESTFEMNHDFFFKSGFEWNRIVFDYTVDYIFVEIGNTRLQPEDLTRLGFDAIWSNGYSALYARRDLAPALRKVARALPPETIQPLDPAIPDKWWPAPH